MKITKLREFKNLLLFTKETLRQFETDEDKTSFLEYRVNKLYEPSLYFAYSYGKEKN